MEHSMCCVEEVCLMEGSHGFYTPDGNTTIIIKNMTTRVYDWFRWNHGTCVYEPAGHSYRPEGTFCHCRLN